MKRLFIASILLFALSFIARKGVAQVPNIDTLVYCGMDSVPFNSKFDGLSIQELSGIEYSGIGNRYIIIPQSRKNAHYFLCTIECLENKVNVEFDSIIYLNTKVLQAESIRIHPKNGQVYIAEEGNKKSFVYKVKVDNSLEKLYASKGSLRYNKGFEGLCFNTDGSKMYIGLERAKSGHSTKIIVYDLNNKTEDVFNYPLDELDNDSKLDNGITELLYLNDSTLLVVERAYLGKEFGNSIRVYEAILPKEGNSIIKSKLLTDFSGIKYVDNIEGVTLSASGNELIFVSDNNSNSSQQTQFICMKIK